ncbi:hypothetical protein EDD99_8165 [Streptomyces sp. 846.5]|nr:hypothetical protein [Streptomyces sp. 846.5]TDT93355.1 hypothetical protein EDD99_8165 [Streptomyces sp. 846.5]
MNQHSPQHTGTDSTVAALTPRPTGTDQQSRYRERAAAALAVSVTVHEDLAGTALGESDAARGRAYKAYDLGDIGRATAEWAAAYGLDGLAAEEHAASLRARAAAARATSVTVPAAPGRSAAQAAPAAPASTGRGAAPQRTR